MSSLILALRDNMRRALSQGHFQEAEDILDRLKQEDRLSAETRGFELELRLESNRLAEAGTLAQQLCRLFPGSGRIAFLAGKVAYRVKDYKRAELHFRESQRIHPHWLNQYWLGKTLTQSGQLEEAESLLLEARARSPKALLELAWLHERRKDLAEALRAYDEYLTVHPGDSFAAEQRLRVRARQLDPESLIGEVDTLAQLGEDVPFALFSEYVEKLFETGQTIEAREAITARMGTLDAKNGSRMAWLCYRAKAYDVACTLFLAYLRPNLAYFKYLNALESAAIRCGRIEQVLAAYRSHTTEAPSLHGRLKALARRSAVSIQKRESQ